MITLDKAQLRALASSPDTPATLRDLYKWQEDAGILYSEKLQLLENEHEQTFARGQLLKVRQDLAVYKVREYLNRWAENYDYVEFNCESPQVLQKLLDCVQRGQSPDAGDSRHEKPLVYLRKYPKIVHNRAVFTRKYSGAMRETLKAFSWVDRGRLRNYLEDSKFEWSSAELGVLAYVLQTYGAVEALTTEELDYWHDLYGRFMPDLIKHIQVPAFAQNVHDVMKEEQCSLPAAEAIVAMRQADALLWKFVESIKPDLQYNEERFKNYRVYTLYVGSLSMANDQFLGRMTAWDRNIKSNGDDSFMLVAMWAPGKPKDTHQYYLIKE